MCLQAAASAPSQGHEGDPQLLRVAHLRACVSPYLVEHRLGDGHGARDRLREQGTRRARELVLSVCAWGRDQGTQRAPGLKQASILHAPTNLLATATAADPWFLAAGSREASGGLKQPGAAAAL